MNPGAQGYSAFPGVLFTSGFLGDLGSLACVSWDTNLSIFTELSTTYFNEHGSPPLPLERFPKLSVRRSSSKSCKSAMKSLCR